MTTYENQKVVHTHVLKQKPFFICSQAAMETAMNLLKPNTFKLWCYLAKNADNYEFALSKVDACRFCGFSDNTYRTARQELEAVGYLVQRGTSNHYDFYEVVHEENDTVTIHKELVF